MSKGGVWRGEKYFSDVVVPVLSSNADFYCFLHKPGGDDHRIDGSLRCACRHDYFRGARMRAIRGRRN
jgi:hypothetical protein